MRPSELKTPLAVLRKQINTPKLRLPQKTIADWLGVSPSHYRKIECGIAPLTWKHVEVLSRKTRINPTSLAEKAGTQLKTVYGKDWTPMDYELACNRTKRVSREIVQAELALLVVRVMAILLCALHEGEPQFYKYFLKIKNALTSILREADNTPNGRPVVSSTSVLGALLACRHTEGRPDLEPLVNAWEKYLKKLKAVGKF